MNNPLKDVTGQKFGRLTALRHIPNRGWECVCSCGAMTVVEASNLRLGYSRSCGCLRVENNKARPADKTEGEP